MGAFLQSVPTQAVELDNASRGIAEVEKAIKSFEKRDFERCAEQLTRAHDGHPELPPPHAFFAKLAVLSK